MTRLDLSNAMTATLQNGIDGPRSETCAYPRSAALFARAKEIIPGGIHLSGRPLTHTDSSPMYMERANGCHVWDVDGNAYIDYLMAFGPYLLGYAHEAIDRAASAQAMSGRLLSMNHPLHVRFVETLLTRFVGMEMGIFFRTGSEATTAALRIARRATGRRRAARCGYHGWHDWCLPLETYVPEGLAEQVPEYDANRPETLRALFDAYPGQIAAVILAPEMVIPHDPAKYFELQQIARSNGAVFVMDEVKTGLRISPGTVSQRIGLVPDILTLSKALGNGWPVAAVLGLREVMRAGDGMHYSATFHGDAAAMAAAMATLDWAERTDAAAHAERTGARLIEGLNAIAKSWRVSCLAYGEPFPAMPFLRFTEPDARVNADIQRLFYEGALRRGVLFHPRHMWFMSLAHDDAVVSRTLEVADEAMRDAAAVNR